MINLSSFRKRLIASLFTARGLVLSIAILLMVAAVSLTIYLVMNAKPLIPDAPKSNTSWNDSVLFFVSILVGSIIPVFFMELIFAMKKKANRLYFRALALKILAYALVATPIIILILLFYVFNWAGVPTLIQVAVSSFLGMFIILNVLHWLNSTGSRRNT